MIRRGYTIGVLIACGAFFLATGCGTVEPQSGDVIVVEAFLSPMSSDVSARVRHSQTVWGPMASQNPVEDADVTLRLDASELLLIPAGDGWYRAELDAPTTPGASVSVNVLWRGSRAVATTVLPFPIKLDSVSVRPAARPVEAVLIDSLQIGATPPETGWLYLIDVSVFWGSDTVDEETFVRARLAPEQSFVGPVIDFFLRSDHIFPEMTAPVQNGHRRWDGVYAVRVESAEAPVPEHELSIALLRSGHDYARYAASRTAPDRREPLGNVTGGIGIVAGVAIDSMRTLVR